VVLTKQLVAAPPNVVTPTALAEIAASIAAQYPETMTLKVRPGNILTVCS
jgi:leucyl aminopeptidase